MLTVKFARQTYEVASLADARAKWNAFRDASGEGCSRIGNGVVVRENGKRIVAKISYNGRVWNPDGSEVAVLS